MFSLFAYTCVREGGFRVRLDGGEHDPHFWLDPLNAKVMVREIQQQLASIDPLNAARYESNAKETEARLDKLVIEIEAELAGLQGI